MGAISTLTNKEIPQFMVDQFSVSPLDFQLQMPHPRLSQRPNFNNGFFFEKAQVSLSLYSFLPIAKYAHVHPHYLVTFPLPHC